MTETEVKAKLKELSQFIDRSKCMKAKRYIFPRKFECFCCIFLSHYYNRFLHLYLQVTQNEVKTHIEPESDVVNFGDYIIALVQNFFDNKQTSDFFYYIWKMKDSTAELTALNYVARPKEAAFFKKIFGLNLVTTALFIVKNLKHLSKTAKEHKSIADEMLFIISEPTDEMPPITLPSIIPIFDNLYALQSFVIYKDDHYSTIVVRGETIICFSHSYVQQIQNIFDFLEGSKIIYCVYSIIYGFDGKVMEEYHNISIPRNKMSDQPILDCFKTTAEKKYSTWFTIQCSDGKKITMKNFCRMIKYPSFYFYSTQTKGNGIWEELFMYEIAPEKTDMSIIVRALSMHGRLGIWMVRIGKFLKILSNHVNIKLDQTLYCLLQIIAITPFEVNFCISITKELIVKFMSDNIIKLSFDQINKLVRAASLAFGKQNSLTLLDVPLSKRDQSQVEDLRKDLLGFSLESSYDWPKYLPISGEITGTKKDGTKRCFLMSTKKFKKIMNDTFGEDYLKSMMPDQINMEKRFESYQTGFNHSNPFWK